MIEYFKPVVLGMYFFTAQPNPAHVSNLDGPAIEVQTNAVGFGAHVMGSSAEFMGAGVHYGLQFKFDEDFSIIAQPFAGMSHTFIPRRELPLGTQFEVGFNLFGKYKQFVFGAKYWHASCAGIADHNIGVDVIGAVFGVELNSLK